jgi:hypothetical protein
MIQLSDNKKIQVIRENPAINREWNHLSKDDRRFMLDGMELGCDQAWLIGLIEDARMLREDRKEAR